MITLLLLFAAIATDNPWAWAALAGYVLFHECERHCMRNHCRCDVQ